ncbi:rpap3 [Acrasis kona]|uniref:Rpap3 n=1 Tax=Acrasis kona TaxID=1008807 RepID=A0AAW2ZKS6_9EUKA
MTDQDLSSLAFKRVALSADEYTQKLINVLSVLDERGYFVGLSEEERDEKLKEVEKEFCKKLSEIYKKEGNNYFAKKRFQVAIELYEASVKYDDKSSISLCNLSAALFNNEEYAKAAYAAKCSINIDPDYAKAYYRLGCCYNKLGLYQEAEKELETALKLDPKMTTAKKTLDEVRKTLNKN